jgi:hypothetical protein
MVNFKDICLLLIKKLFVLDFQGADDENTKLDNKSEKE